jgi:tetratricopeptide (TPR) repeat protein
MTDAVNVPSSPAEPVAAEPAGEERLSRLPRFGVLIAVALAVVAAAYAVAPQGAFLWDDRPLILESPSVHDPDLVETFLHPFWQSGGAAGAAYYRPLITLLYALEWRLYGVNPAGYHVTNLLLHLLAVALVALLARRAGATPLAASLAAAVWGLAPRLTESVAWISGRTDIASAVFAFAALLTWGRGVARRAAAAVLLLAGLLCKEVAIAFVPAVFAFELASRRGEHARWRNAATALWPLAPALGAYAVLRSVAMSGVPITGAGVTLLRHAAVVLHTIGTYVAMLFDPLRPAMQIGLAGQIDSPHVVAGAVTIALLAAAVWRARDRCEPGVAAALVLAAGALGLVVRIIPLPISVVAADRFLYVPLAGLAIAAGAMASRLTPKRAGLALATAGVAAVAFGIATFRRTETFSDEVAFWADEARRAPIGSVIPGVEIGNALSNEARYEEALGLYQRVLSDLRGANAQPPEIVRDVRRNVAIALARIGRVGDAIRILDVLVEKAPDDAALVRSRATLLLMARRWAEVDHDLDALDRIAPGDANAQALRKAAGSLRHDWEALEARRAAEGDTAKLLVAQARLLARMDAQREAGERYESVVARADATLPELREASVWLVRRGRIEAATLAVDRYAAAGATDGTELCELLTLRTQRYRQMDAALARLRD